MLAVASRVQRNGGDVVAALLGQAAPARLSGAARPRPGVAGRHQDGCADGRPARSGGQVRAACRPVRRAHRRLRARGPACDRPGDGGAAALRHRPGLPAGRRPDRVPARPARSAGRAWSAVRCSPPAVCCGSSGWPVRWGGRHDLRPSVPSGRDPGRDDPAPWAVAAAGLGGPGRAVDLAGSAGGDALGDGAAAAAAIGCAVARTRLRTVGGCSAAGCSELAVTAVLLRAGPLVGPRGRRGRHRGRRGGARLAGARRDAACPTTADRGHPAGAGPAGVLPGGRAAGPVGAAGRGRGDRRSAGRRPRLRCCASPSSATMTSPPGGPSPDMSSSVRPPSIWPARWRPGRCSWRACWCTPSWRREERHGQVEEAARRVGVRSVLPLMVCFIPAFLLLGIVPTVASAVLNALHF